MKNVEIIDLNKKSDARGWFMEVIDHEGVSPHTKFGEVHVVMALPGKFRGNHYHKRKDEWLCVISGTANLVLENTTTGETQEVLLSEDQPKIAKIGPGVIHTVKNIGETNMVLFVYTSEKFNRDSPDTFYPPKEE